MTTPRLSVVIPVFNGEATIERTIESVLRQTLADYELLLVNDGSTDGTLVRISRFTDPRIKVHAFPNAGLAASRNRGIREARGEFVAFLDADDLWTPGKLERQVAAFRDQPGVDLVYGWSDCIDADDGFLLPGNHMTHNGRVYEHLLLGNFLENGSTPMVRRTAFNKAGVFDEALPAAEDWDMWLRLAWHGEVACVPEVLTYYRIHGQAMSSNLRRQEAACLRVLDTAIARLPPGAQRDELRRQSLMMIYQYLAGRALFLDPDRDSARQALRYIRAYARTAPLNSSTSGWVIRQRIRAGIVFALPAPAARWTLDRLARHNRAKPAT